MATNAQQIGIQYTSAGKAGFITALYIVFVPIIGIFLKKKCSWNVWVSVVIAVIGFYLLCVKDGLSLSKGDLWVLVCALVFPFHIWTVNHFAPMVDGVRLSCIQFLVCGILSGICMFFTGNTGYREYPTGMDATIICVRIVLWSGIYLTDYRTEGF